MIGLNGKIMPSHKLNDDAIALVDSSTNISEIKKIIEKTGRLITLDYESHKTLLKNKIQHEISDNHITSVELDEIQKKSYYFSKWANSSQLNNLLDYKGFNLGNFFYLEIFIYFIPTLKKLWEIHVISQKYNNSKFFCSENLKSMVNLFNKSCEGFGKKNLKTTEFFGDYIELQNNLFRLKISRTNYFRLKKILENSFNALFGPKKNNYSNGILLVEFNTNLYGPLFLKMNEKNMNIFYYSRKRPAFWNASSFSIIKKSNCIVLSGDSLSNKKIEEEIKNDSDKLTLKIITMLKNNNFLESFFSIDNISFWNIIKSSFLKLCERRIKEAIHEVNLARILLENLQPKCVLVLSEIGYTDQVVINQSKQLKIPVILVQHGVFANDSPESHEINKFIGSMPIISDKFLGWGNAIKKYSKQFGISENKIKILGSSVHDSTFKKKDKGLKIKKEFILLSTGFATHSHVIDYSVKANEEYELVLRAICKIVSKAKKKLVIKIHPYAQSIVEERIAKEIDPNISIIKKGDMISLIESCELMITLAMTSAILDAQIFEKPVLRIPLTKRFGAVDTLRASPGLTVPINDFEKTFNKIITSNNFRLQVIKEGKKFVDDCLVNQGNATENITNFLKNLN